MFKKRKRSAIESSISHEYERAFVDLKIFRFNRELGRDACGNLRRLNEITEWSKTAFQAQAGFLNHLRVESNAGELRKVLLIGPRKIDKAGVSVLNDIPAKSEVVCGKTKLGGKDIHCSERQKAENHVRSGQADLQS